MKKNTIFFRLILIIFLAFAYFTCDDFNLLTGAMGYPTPSEIQKIIAPDAEDNDWFGYSVSISGDYAIVGACTEDGAGSDRGAAYIFHRTGITTWDAGVKIIAPDAEDGDWFGMSVSISGDYAIVGAFFENGAGTFRGAAYIFHRTGINTWDTGVKIIAPDAEDNDMLSTVSISGDYAIVGACYEDGAGSDRGAAYIFHRTGITTWDAGVKITAPDAEDNDWFGGAVSISGDYAVVGASMEDEAGSDRGAAYIFHRTGINSWDAGVKIIAPDAEDNDSFGSTLSIAGAYAIVGAKKENGAGTERGAAYIFHRTGINSWDAGVKITAPDAEDNDAFGMSVAISGDYVIVGAAFEDGTGSDRGAAYFFYHSAIDTWDFGGKITASDAQDNDSFGLCSSISGEYVIIGTDYEDGIGSDRGAAYIFK